MTRQLWRLFLPLALTALGTFIAVSAVRATETAVPAEAPTTVTYQTPRRSGGAGQHRLRRGQVTVPRLFWPPGDLG